MKHSIHRGEGRRRWEPDFEASEYTRIFHSLQDAWMQVTRRLVMLPRSQEELDTVGNDP